MAVDLKYGKLEIPGIPADEPVFVLRAQDYWALDTIDSYLARCDGGPLSSPTAHLAGVREAALAFQRWQLEYETKVPD